MAEISSFPNNSDEYQGAEEVMRWLHGRTSGVYAGDGNAAVSAVENTMQVQVAPGIGWIVDAAANGVCWWFDQPITLTVDAAESTGTLNRIDRVIVEWKTTDYADLPEVKILKGANRSTAVAPALTNNSTVRQLSLAQISIPAGTTKLTALSITDERMNPDVCGLVTETVTADLSMISAQYEEALAQLESAISQAWGGVISDGAIDTDKLEDEAVTPEKLSPDVLSAIYPVGSIYMAVNDTSPASLFGGTWERIKDRFLLSAGDTYAAGAEGGSATKNLQHDHTTQGHTLTVNEIPSHDHDANSNYMRYYTDTRGYGLGSSGGHWRDAGNGGVANAKVGARGGGGSHSHGNTGNALGDQDIMPPYLSVYVWKRTA